VCIRLKPVRLTRSQKHTKSHSKSELIDMSTTVTAETCNTTNSNSIGDEALTCSSNATSLTRRFRDLDPYAFVSSLVLLAAIRAAFVQPINVFLVHARVPQATHTGAAKTPWWRRPLAFWCVGMPAFVAGSALSEASSIFVLEALRDAWWDLTGRAVDGDGDGASTAVGDFAAGYLSDGVRQILLTPFSVIATRQVLWASCAAAAVKSSRRSFVSTYRALWAERGIRTLYAGFGTSIAIGPIWTASWWVLYNQWKRYLYHVADPFLFDDPADGITMHPEAVSLEGAVRSRTTEVNQTKESAPPWWRLRGDNVLIDTTASVFASVMAAVVFNPFLVIRTRLMAAHGGGSLPSVMQQMWREGRDHQHSAAGVVVAGRHTAAAGRFGGFRWMLWFRPMFAGTTMTVLQNVVDGVGASLTYECARRWSERR
jgi:hypothetical protein